MKARKCEGCGETGQTAAYYGRYFHRRCFKTWRVLTKPTTYTDKSLNADATKEKK